MGTQIHESVNKRKVLELRLTEAKQQGKEVALQHIAAEILITNHEISEMNLKIKEAQKESYFLTLEKKRKLGTVKKLKEEILVNKQKDLLKKKIEEKIKKDGLLAALDAVSSIAERIKTKINSPKKKLTSGKEDNSNQSNTSDQQQRFNEGMALQEEEDEDEEEEGDEEEGEEGEEEEEGEEGEEEENGGNVAEESRQNFQSADNLEQEEMGAEEEDEEDDGEEEGEEEEGEEEEEGDEQEGEEDGEEEEEGEEGEANNENENANPLLPAVPHTHHQPTNHANYISEDEEDLNSPFNRMNLSEDHSHMLSPVSLQQRPGPNDPQTQFMNYHEEDDDDDDPVNISHSAGNAYHAAKALRMNSTEL
jgi:hypothetical protein